MPEPPSLDPADGLPVSDIGLWGVEEKHARLRRYVNASRAARNRFIGPGNAGATYIDLFCGFGRSRVREDGKIIDGSPLVAHREATRGGVPFSALHVADVDEFRVEATTKRLERLGANVCPYTGPASEIVHKVLDAIHPAGLHIVFLDPYNLKTLPFLMIERLAGALRRLDMLVHVSTMDLQRNFRDYLNAKECELDAFCPGWREVVTSQMPEREARRRVLNFWVEKIRGLDLKVYEDHIESVRGSKNQSLYWLVFASREHLAHKLWNAIRHVSPQRKFEFK